MLKSLNFLFKEGKTDRFKDLFRIIEEIKTMVHKLYKVFINMSILIYYNIDLFIQIEINTSQIIIIKVLLQQLLDNNLMFKH